MRSSRAKISWLLQVSRGRRCLCPFLTTNRVQRHNNRKMELWFEHGLVHEVATNVADATSSAGWPAESVAAKTSRQRPFSSLPTLRLAALPHPSLLPVHARSAHTSMARGGATKDRACARQETCERTAALQPDKLCYAPPKPRFHSTFSNSARATCLIFSNSCRSSCEAAMS